MRLTAGALGATLLRVPALAASEPRPRRRVLDGRYVPPSLGHEVSYAIHLPPASDRRDSDLPILFFLHGLRDDENFWEREDFADLCEELTSAGKIPPMAIAIPAGRGGLYTNAYRGGPREEDAVFPDFVDFTERRLLGMRPRGKRAIAGISMGGYGALKIGLKHPGSFAAVASLSGALAEPGVYVGNASGREESYLVSIFGPKGDEKMREANDEYRIIGRLDAAAAPAIFLACGTEDRFHFDAGLAGVRAALKERGVEPEVSVSKGRHAYSYWRKTMPDLLAFVGRHFVP